MTATSRPFAVAYDGASSYNSLRVLFDSFLGHMSGREQPTEFPEPDEWRLLMGAARRYQTTAPWRRWPDSAELVLELHHDSTVDRYVASVLGHERIQRGLVISRGRTLPRAFRNWTPTRPMLVPPRLGG